MLNIIFIRAKCLCICCCHILS